MSVYSLKVIAGAVSAMRAFTLADGGGCAQLWRQRPSRALGCCFGRRSAPMQRPMVVRCFMAEEERTSWHTLQLKHVIESQQFDPVCLRTALILTGCGTVQQPDMTLPATLPLSLQLGLKEALLGTTAVRRQDLLLVLLVLLRFVAELPQPYEQSLSGPGLKLAAQETSACATAKPVTNCLLPSKP